MPNLFESDENVEKPATFHLCPNVKCAFYYVCFYEIYNLSVGLHGGVLY